MRKKRLSPELIIKEEHSSNTSNILTFVNLHSVIKILEEFKEVLKPIATVDKVVELSVEALLLYYC